MSQAQTAASHGYVLGATDGEHLVHWRDAGNIFIKVGPATGSNDLALGTQQVPVGAGIPIHRHFRMDEASTFWKAAEFSHSTMHNTLLGRAERYSFPRMLGMGSPIPITNCSCSGSWRLPAWTASSATPVVRPGYRQSN